MGNEASRLGVAHFQGSRGAGLTQLPSRSKEGGSRSLKVQKSGVHFSLPFGEEQNAHSMKFKVSRTFKNWIPHPPPAGAGVLPFARKLICKGRKTPGFFLKIS